MTGKLKILFMGTPDFAVSSLAALDESGSYALTVITQPDKPKGRGYVLTPSEVKVYALAHGLPVYQPQTLKGEAFAALLDGLAPDMIVVAAYGKLLPENVIGYPRYGCINVHGSLLPKYRGAAPIQRAILDGETVTGITVMRMDAGLDTGDMLLKKPVPITPEDNFETLFDRMARAGAEALTEAIPMILAGTVVPEKQDDALSCYARKIEKEDCVLDFTRSAKWVYDRIRGLSPFPLAVTAREGTVLKIVAALPSEKTSEKEPGSVIAAGDSLTVVCGDGHCVEITEVLPAGKKRMKVADFLRGNKLAVGTVLGK